MNRTNRAACAVLIAAAGLGAQSSHAQALPVAPGAIPNELLGAGSRLLPAGEEFYPTIVLGRDRARLQFGHVVADNVVVNIERLFEESAYGNRVRRERNEARAALIEENVAYVEALQQEERLLAELRKFVSVEEFDLIAGAFDRKVNERRFAQDRKGRDLDAWATQEATVFEEIALETIRRIASRENYRIVMRSATIAVYDNAIDITNAVLRELGEFLGDGTQYATYESALQYAVRINR